MITTSGRNPNGGQGDGTYRSSARAVATELYTLGGVRVTQQGSALDVSLGAKHLALLIYLFQERRPMHPFEVVELLGHGQGYDRELDGLKRTVKWLNQAVPFVNIRITSDTIEGLSGVWLDTMDMEAAIDAKKPVRVAKLYVGEFLEGFESGNQTFDEWAKKERGRLKRAWDHSMTRAAREAAEAGKWRTAAEWWRIIVSRAPMRSEPVARLLEAYARTGRREEAMQAYEDYYNRLRRSGVSDVPGVVKQVIGRFPMLQRIAAKPRPQSTRVRPQAPEPPKAESPLPPWDLEPAPAPPGAFDLPFELPEIEIPSRLELAQKAPQVERKSSAPNSTPARSTRTFHVLDEPMRAEFSVGAAQERARRPADELVVETVAMAFEKIAAHASKPEASDGNGGSGGAEDEVDHQDHPAGFSDNRVNGGQDGNGAPHLPAEPRPKDQSESSREPDEKREEQSRAKGETATDDVTDAEGVAGEPPADVPTTRAPQTPARDERARDRDLYHATAAILSAFVDDDDEVNADEGRGWIAEAPPPEDSVLAEVPDADARDPWDDFSVEPAEDESAEIGTAHDADPASTPVGGAAIGATPPQEPQLQWEGRALLFEDSISAGPDDVDLDLDKIELYGGQVTRVRHNVTSVRKAWAPVLRDAWTEVSEWIAHAFGSLLARLRRAPDEGQPTGSGGRPEVADYYEPWAQEPTAYADTRDDVEPYTQEVPTSFSGGEEVASREDQPADMSAEASDLIEQEAEAEAPVEWYEAWDHGTPDGVFDETYGVERETDVPAAKIRSRAVSSATAPFSLLRRYWYAPVGVVVVAAALALGPKLIGLFSGSGGETAGVEGASSPQPSRPKLTVRAPAFVETSIAKISQLFSRSILDAPGQWVIVADLESSPTEQAASDGDVTAEALTLAIEADLMQARFFFVFPRGRALSAQQPTESEGPDGLRREAALALAGSEGISAVIAGTLHRGADGDSLVLEVLHPDGRAAYRVSRPVSEEAGRLSVLNELTRDLRRRLGEPAEDIEASVPIREFLSDNPEAVSTYAQAVEEFHAGRYRDARRDARAAARLDTTFAVAYHLEARALAAVGARRQALTALQAAVEVRDHATERERLRILGDWLTLTGRVSDAALTYDELFNRHRDDVGALRSQAVAQRLVGAPGEGMGNLRVAYAIDRYDWPSLATIAQFLGYRGPLPSQDSLQATP